MLKVLLYIGLAILVIGIATAIFLLLKKAKDKEAKLKKQLEDCEEEVQQLHLKINTTGSYPESKSIGSEKDESKI